MGKLNPRKMKCTTQTTHPVSNSPRWPGTFTLRLNSSTKQKRSGSKSSQSLGKKRRGFVWLMEEESQLRQGWCSGTILRLEQTGSGVGCLKQKKTHEPRRKARCFCSESPLFIGPTPGLFTRLPDASCYLAISL